MEVKEFLNKQKEAYMESIPDAAKEIMAQQIDLVVEGLAELAGEDQKLAENIQKTGKSMEKCFRWIEKKAYETIKPYAQRTPAGNCMTCAVTSDTLFQWIKEYYAIDEEAEEKRRQEKAEQDAKEKAEREARAAEEKAAYEEKFGVDISSESGIVPFVARKKKNDCEGQLDLFSSLLG